MSADPFANTTTVKNILQHVISPKIVKDGNGGYVTKTDLVNVHNLVFSSVDRTVLSTPENPIVNVLGSINNPFTAQCGRAILSVPVGNRAKRFIFRHNRVTPNSVIVATFINDPSGRFIARIEPQSQEFEVLTSIELGGGESLSFSWFIAAF